MRKLEVLNAGDGFVYEMQTGGANGKYVPADYNKAVWHVTQEVLKLGIHVAAAAGNGNKDLDKSDYDEYRDHPDNGIIRVGGGNRLNLRQGISTTYGNMIHLQGWMSGVTTTGGGHYIAYIEGELEENRGYMFDFNGTSSATPIVASAVVAVQSWYK